MVSRLGGLSFEIIKALDQNFPDKLDGFPAIYTKGKKELLGDQVLYIVGDGDGLGGRQNEVLCDLMVKQNYAVLSDFSYQCERDAYMSACHLDKAVHVPDNSFHISDLDNSRLVERIEDHGLLVSQFPPCLEIIANELRISDKQKVSQRLREKLADAVLIIDGESSKITYAISSAIRQDIPIYTFEENLAKDYQWLDKGIKREDTLIELL